MQTAEEEVTELRRKLLLLGVRRMEPSRALLVV
jgi:hypothetical protein